MASNVPVQSPDLKQGEGNVNRAPEPQTTISTANGIERHRVFKKVRSKKPRVLFKTAGLHGTVKTPYIRRYKDNIFNHSKRFRCMRELNHANVNRCHA